MGMDQSQKPRDQVTDAELPVRDPGDLSNYDNDQLIDFYASMLFVRRFEERVAEMYLRAKIGGYCHLNIGEEATVVGTLKPLEMTTISSAAIANTALLSSVMYPPAPSWLSYSANVTVAREVAAARCIW